ncbi:penicillin-binding protein 1B [Pseudomonadales bacterium]|nr:penicillin-binding protein 1B [Pseudomonadales bacterium]
MVKKVQEKPSRKRTAQPGAKKKSSKSGKKASQKNIYEQGGRSPLKALVGLLKWLIHPLALKVYLSLLVIFVSYVIYLDATIRSSFDGKKWQLPARVYARPLELFNGLGLSADELESELIDLGYRPSSATQPGSYYRSGKTITLYSRGYQFWDGDERAQQAQITFKNGRIAQLQTLAQRPLPLLRLEPMEIGAIYPRHREDRILVKIEDVPPLLTAALLAVEDHRFYQHHGVSPAAIARAALANARSGSVVQGGSTITQQLVKNFYLDQRRTLRRKFTEALMSLLLEIHYEKEPILEAYLNEVYLGQAGARGVHGFGLASQHYFNRSLHELSIEKLALLVAVVRGPTYYDPWRHASRAIDRRNRVLDALVLHGLLAEEDSRWAREQPLNLGKKSQSHFVFPAYMDMVKRQLAEVYQQQDLVSNGLKIYTSFDPRVQRSAERAVQDRLAKMESGAAALSDKQLQAAVLVTHPATGEVMAIVGGRNPRYAGFNRALDARRSIGSVIKPFVYLTALEQPERYTLATLLDDAPIPIKDRNGGVWSPRNFDRKDHGEVPLVTAMAKSYNQATARLGDSVGLDSVIETLKEMGQQRELLAVPSLFIGTTQLAPVEVASLYQTIATNGFRTPLKAIRSVLDKDGQPLERFPYQTQQAGSVQSNYLIQQALVHVGKYGSAVAASGRLGDGTFAGKTGTSGGQRDSWFAGYTGDLLAVVWVGYDDNTQTPYTGSSGALPIWSDLIARSSRQSLQLLAPANIVDVWVNVRTGQRTRSACSNAYRLPFIEGSEPKGPIVCDGLKESLR